MNAGDPRDGADGALSTHGAGATPTGRETDGALSTREAGAPPPTREWQPLDATGALGRALEAQRERLLPCVHCGFCLPACPTYNRLGDEADSPRGRLHLMGAVVDGRLDPASDAFRTHIDRCLGCRACEPVCPSGVEYGALLELARDVAARQRAPEWPTRLLLTVFGSRPGRGVFFLGGRILRATGLAGLGARILPGMGVFGSAKLGLAMLDSSRRWGGLGWHRTSVPEGRRDGLDRRDGQAAHGHQGGPGGAMPRYDMTASAAAMRLGRPRGAGTEVTAALDSPTESSPGATAHTPLTRPEDADTLVVGPAAVPGAGTAAPEPGSAGRVVLLTGCVQEGLYARINRATERVLVANGYAVVQAGPQECCGALHAHGGALDEARRLARVNVDRFEEADVDAVVVNAGGCGAVMKEYGTLLGDDPDFAHRAAGVAAKVRDVTELLAAVGPRAGAPVPTVVAYDHPCHLLHAQRVEHPPLAVLAAVPGVEIRVIENAAECCGGAGIYGLTHAELGGRIGRDKVSAVRAACAEVLATPNPGCMMQIGGGLRMEGAEEGVVHPVELLDESYRRAGFYDLLESDD